MSNLKKKQTTRIKQFKFSLSLTNTDQHVNNPYFSTYQLKTSLSWKLLIAILLFGIFPFLTNSPINEYIFLIDCLSYFNLFVF